jgi:CRISPR/Cas system-associated exonuclease Cas4 (RecB family)
MVIKDRFEYPALDRVTLASGSRYYVCPDSEKRLPSVTTILSATSDKDFSAWVARVGVKKADQERKYGTDLGSLVHEHLECHMLNEDRPGGNNLIRVEAKRMSDVVIEKQLGDVGEVWGIETPLYMPELYAGTTDVVGLYRGKQSIIDFKTAKKLRKRADIMDYRDQLAAYKLAHDEKYGTNIEQGVIFMVARNLECETFIYDAIEMADGCESFLNRVSQYYASFTGFA